MLDDERLAEHFSVTKRPPAARCLPVFWIIYSGKPRVGQKSRKADVICLRSKSRPQATSQAEPMMCHAAA